MLAVDLSRGLVRDAYHRAADGNCVILRYGTESFIYLAEWLSSDAVFFSTAIVLDPRPPHGFEGIRTVEVRVAVILRPNLPQGRITRRMSVMDIDRLVGLSFGFPNDIRRMNSCHYSSWFWANRPKPSPSSQSIQALLDDSMPSEIMFQAVMTERGANKSDGTLIIACSLPWFDIVREIERDPLFLQHFAQHHREFEEFVAGAYKRAGFDEVTLTPASGDGGRDVIAVKHGFGSIRFLDQCKAYSPGHVVTHNDVRAMLGVLQTDRNASKAIITTTSDFAPGVLSSDEFTPFTPHRLELKSGPQLIEWLKEINNSNPADAAPK